MGLEDSTLFLSDGGSIALASDAVDVSMRGMCECLDVRDAAPGLTVASALRRLADQPHLLALVAPDRAVLQWGLPPRPLQTLADLRPPPGRVQTVDADAWACGLRGGAIVQCDYELPVGAWAATLPAAAGPRGWMWELRRSLQWQGGRAQVVAEHADLGQQALADLRRPERRLPAIRTAGPLQPVWDFAAYSQRIDVIKAAIHAGEIYQANLTLPSQVRMMAEPGLDVALFLRLMRRSPAGFMALLRTPRQSVISHSPECFLAGDGASVLSAPIKGTRRRWRGREASVRQELLSAEKDNAELAMIIDLVRNDLGRIATVGGVRVPRMPHVMDLDYVHHLLAHVRAELPPGTDAQALLAAAFPPGSITGAPKIRAMQLLKDLEHGPRGPYCGVFGWMAAAGACSLAVAIRTMVLRGDRLRLHAGGGIVADSEARLEWQEMRSKLAAMTASVQGPVVSRQLAVGSPLRKSELPGTDACHD